MTHLSKPKRIKNVRLLNRIRNNGYNRCQICGTIPSQTHHIDTVGRGGDDTADNIVRLCFTHHKEAHNAELTEDYLRELAQERIKEEGE